MMKHRKDYVDLHRTTEHEKDSIEHEVTHLSLLGLRPYYMNFVAA